MSQKLEKILLRITPPPLDWNPSHSWFTIPATVGFHAFHTVFRVAVVPTKVKFSVVKTQNIKKKKN